MVEVEPRMVTDRRTRARRWNCMPQQRQPPSLTNAAQVSPTPETRLLTVVPSTTAPAVAGLVVADGVGVADHARAARRCCGPSTGRSRRRGVCKRSRCPWRSTAPSCRRRAGRRRRRSGPCAESESAALVAEPELAEVVVTPAAKLPADQKRAGAVRAQWRSRWRSRSARPGRTGSASWSCWGTSCCSPAPLLRRRRAIPSAADRSVDQNRASESLVFARDVDGGGRLAQRDDSRQRAGRRV